MSTDVYIYVNRKADNMPSGRYYLGGNGTRQAMYFEFEQAETLIDGFAIFAIGPAEYTKGFLMDRLNEFYSDNCFNALHQDYLSKSNADDYSYWLVFEY